MFIRFITEYKNEFGQIETGVFQAMDYLLRSEQTFDFDKILLKELRNWFNTHLERPEKFTKSKSNNAPAVALSWYKSSASDHLSRMYDLKAVLDRYDIVVDVVKREKPGYILYEDDFQVTTLPYKTDKNLVRGEQRTTLIFTPL